jgi:hypothetical protein
MKLENMFLFPYNFKYFEKYSNKNVHEMRVAHEWKLVNSFEVLQILKYEKSTDLINLKSTF